MIQKTMITNNTDELSEYIQGLRELPEYRSPGGKLVIFSAPAGEAENIERRNTLLHASMPDAKIVGMTTPERRRADGSKDVLAEESYSFLLMNRAKADLFFYDCGEMSAQEAGRRFRRELREKENVACVLVFSAGLEYEIDQFITTVGREGVSDVPILGAQSGGGHPYLCGSFRDGRAADRGIAAAVFYGQGLNIYYNYDMGWKAIGKEMTVTGVDGATRMTSVDNMRPTDVYREYLGVEPDEYFVENVREFPFITLRGEREVVRTPLGCEQDGSLDFIAKVNRGDIVRLSYGNPKRLMEKTRLYADSMRLFGPQALFLVICENRLRFLGEQSIFDIAAYRSFMPQTAWLRGRTAVMLDKKGGGIVNSAIVSVGLREGAQNLDDLERPVVITSDTLTKGAIPLERRLAMFLEKTTKELETMAVEAQAANVAKSEFLSMMSHEIRTPINAILGMNEMILRESDSENVLTYAENVQTASLSLLGIINEILDFSKIEAGKMDIVAHTYELASMIHDLVNLIRMRAEERGLNLYIRVNPKTPHLLVGDELQVKQIITNILTNAVKYTEKGSVTFVVDYRKTSEEEIALEISVEDTGVGIKEENIHKLFKAFDRIDAERTRKIEGTGLGLNITQQLLHLMGSRLEVKSEYGKGSVFSFALPQKVSEWGGVGEVSDILKRAREKRAKKKTRFTAPKARILVVDDAPMNLAVISGLLKRTRIQVDTADSGEECLEKFAAASYDLVFLDHRMPNMDGIETLGRMKELYPDRLAGVPVISLTANAMSGAREEYMAVGFSDYLAKPVMVDELEETLLKYLPRDKVSFDEEMPKVEEAAEVELPAWLSELPMLHTDQGIMYCGGEGEYLDALALFAASIESRANEIERLYREEDYENYTIKVHTLKSVAKAVGAMEISELAAELEAAGKAGDIATIGAGTDALLSIYRGLAASLARLGEDPETAKRVKAAQGNVVTEKRHTILLVDDDEDFLALISRWLKKEYAVTAVNSGKKALKYLETERPELMLLDYEMPVMSGADVLKVIRETPTIADLPVVFLTGTDDRAHVKRAESLRPEGFLTKTMGKSGLLMGIAAFFD
ncbi:MAG: response regulator [Schwartzia sp.]|nr:response regulator [Schwartzia sp. (in: firmicutes)]